MASIEDKYRVIRSYLRSLYPEHPYIYFGQNVSSLLYKAFRNERFNKIILPGFFCAEQSAMTQLTGKTLVHIDVNPSTLHIKTDLLCDYIQKNTTSDTCLWLDHSFGYIYSDVARIRKQYPNLLIIEDCVRAYGGKCQDLPPGSSGDWILLSMYKTVPGNTHGGILLSRNRLSCTDDKAHRSSIKEYLLTLNAFRFFYSQARRRMVTINTTPSYHDTIRYSPTVGLPSPLSASRYLNGLEKEPELSVKRNRTWDYLHYHLGQYPEISLIKVQEGTTPAKHFLSFVLNGLFHRNDLLLGFLQKLHQEGFSLLKTWLNTPNYYRCFQDTFPYGDENTKYLAQNIVHIPIASFLNRKHQDQFLRRLEIHCRELNVHANATPLYRCEKATNASLS